MYITLLCTFCNIGYSRCYAGIDDEKRCSLILFYFQYEILFCVQDKNDPAISVVEKLMDKYPDVDSRLFQGW